MGVESEILRGGSHRVGVVVDPDGGTRTEQAPRERENAGPGADVKQRPALEIQALQSLEAQARGRMVAGAEAGRGNDYEGG
jgi:hypothetical protein